MSMKPYTFINRLLQLDREIKEKNLNVYSREFLEDEEGNQFIQIVCEGNYMRCSVFQKFDNGYKLSIVKLSDYC